jgi:hypothetical protein
MYTRDVCSCNAAGGLMSDATKLPADQQAAAMASISAEGLPQAIERQAAAGAQSACAAE